MIDLLHFVRDTDILVYYVLCYGILIFGGGFILSFLGMCFCALGCWFKELRVEKENRKKRNKVNIEIYEGKPGTGMSLNYLYPLEIIDSDSGSDSGSGSGSGSDSDSDSDSGSDSDSDSGS